MSLNVNFTFSQSYATPTLLTLNDTSTGSDGTITVRQVYIKKWDGNYLVPQGNGTNYISWPIANASIDIPVLDKDYVLDITVVWLNGSTPTYSKNILCYFVAYSQLFLRQLTQKQASNPLLITNRNFWYNKCQLRTLVDDVLQAVSVQNDQTIATFALNEALKLTSNPSTFQ